MENEHSGWCIFSFLTQTTSGEPPLLMCCRTGQAASLIDTSLESSSRLLNINGHLSALCRGVGGFILSLRACDSARVWVSAQHDKPHTCQSVKGPSIICHFAVVLLSG